ncbi:MAG: YdcF family protein [Actinomycetota bacterium]
MGVIRRHPVLAVIFLALIGVVGVIAVTFFAVWRAAHTDDARLVDHADVIIVLGAAQYSGTPSPVFVGRLEQAANLYEQGRSTRVLVVGANQPGDHQTEAEAGRDWLVRDGLPSTAVFADPQGNTTLESLQGAASFMRARSLASAFLVSDPWHNLRVKRMASDLGIHAYASATWHSAARSEDTRFEGYLRETFAYLYYRLFHR